MFLKLSLNVGEMPLECGVMYRSRETESKLFNRSNAGVNECIFASHDGTLVRVMPAESDQRNFATRTLI